MSRPTPEPVQGESPPATLGFAFEWTRSSEGENAKEVLAVLQAAKFAVETTQTNLPGSEHPEHLLEASLSDVIHQTEIERLVSKIESLASGPGSNKWHMQQVRRSRGLATRICIGW
jgi:hypothetical protein